MASQRQPIQDFIESPLKKNNVLGFVPSAYKPFKRRTGLSTASAIALRIRAITATNLNKGDVCTIAVASCNTLYLFSIHYIITIYRYNNYNIVLLLYIVKM